MPIFPELPSHQPDPGEPEQQRGTLGRVAPYVELSYTPRLARDDHALAYENLEVRYREETVRPGSRGVFVAGETKPAVFLAKEQFATLDVAAVEGKPDTYELNVQLDSDVISKSGIDKHQGIPYGYLYVKPDKVEEARQEGGLTSHLQHTLAGRFEVDVIKAVLGDNHKEWFGEKKTEHEEVIFLSLLYNWNSIRATHAENTDTYIPETQVRTLSSPSVRQALKRLPVENSPHP